MKKKLVALASAAILVCGMAVLAGCGKSDEEIITDLLTSEFEAMKTLDEEYVAGLAESAGANDLADFGIDATEFVKSYLDGFDYTLDSVAVEGETAKATCTVTVKSITEFYDKFTSKVNSMDYNELMNMSEDELNKKMGSILMEILDGLTPVKSDPIVLNMQKDGNTWAYADGVEDAISNALMAL